MSTKFLKNKRYIQSTEELGKGAFAVVHPGRDTKDNRIVAIKKIDTNKHKEFIERIDQECQLHQSLPKNCHILEFIDNFNESNHIFIVTEMCEFGDLDCFQQRFENKILPEDVAKLFTNQILYGFTSLYELEIIHRDMKLQNILINKNFECKIADFGLAKSSHDLGQTQAGTPLTMSPEILFNENYDRQCDVWSFGCIVYAMTHGRYPFYPTGFNKRQELEDMVRNRKLIFTNPNISEECKQFIDKTLKVNPKERITFLEMFNEPWLQQCQYPDFQQNVINKYLKHLTYQERHINNEFAGEFGITLRNYLDITIKRHCQLLENVYLKFITKENQTNAEKKVLYLLNLLIYKICDMKIDFLHKGKVVKLPLTSQQIQQFINFILSQTRILQIMKIQILFYLQFYCKL